MFAWRKPAELSYLKVAGFIPCTTEFAGPAIRRDLCLASPEGRPTETPCGCAWVVPRRSPIRTRRGCCLGCWCSHAWLGALWSGPALLLFTALPDCRPAAIWEGGLAGEGRRLGARAQEERAEEARVVKGGERPWDGLRCCLSSAVGGGAQCAEQFW